MSDSTDPRDSRLLPARAAATLCRREIVRFLRQRNRVIGALGQPILFWLLFGAGLQQSFRLGGTTAGGPTFLEYYFPGTLVLILLFTAIFATISVIEDRREGFLQAVLVAPVPRWSMVLGKVAGGSLIATLQGALFLLLAVTLPLDLTVGRLSALLGLMLVSATGLTSLGFFLAWRMDSTQGFHAVMNLLLMPLWLLSGAFFPIPAVHANAGWGHVALHWAMRINPVSYSVAGVRQLLYDNPAAAAPWMPSLATCWLVAGGFAVFMFVAAALIARKHTTGDLL